MKHSKRQDKKYLEEYEDFEMLLKRWTGAMKAKVIVLPKRDFNHY